MSRLFGNRAGLAFEIRPLQPSWERRYPPEATGWAALSVWVAGINLCEYIDPDTNQIQDALNVPLAPIADWLVRAWPYLRYEERPFFFAGSEQPIENAVAWGETLPPAGFSEDDWLDQREAWWSRHFLSAGTDGLLLPQLALVRLAETAVVEWAGRSGAHSTRRWIRGAGARNIPWSAVEDATAAFVAFVAEWLHEEGLGDLYAWIRRGDPLREPVNADLALELYTGRPLSELAELLAAQHPENLRQHLGLLQDSTDPGASPLTQALRDMPPKIPVAAREPLEWLRKVVHEPKNVDARTHLRNLAHDAARHELSPEGEGYRSAEAIRRFLRLDGQPIGDLGALLDSLGVVTQPMALEATNVRMLVGALADRGAGTAILANGTGGAPWAQRFEAARALGHLLLDPYRSGAIGAASSSYCLGERRRRSGTFAAEFLLPFGALRQITGGVLDAAASPEVFRGLLERFQIGARAAAHHLRNHRLLSSDEVRDQLIEEYAAAG